MDLKKLVFFSLIVLLLPIVAWAGVVSDTADIGITENDCRGVDIPSFDSTDTYYYLANSLIPSYTGATRFLDIDIAQGTTVDSASLLFRVWRACDNTDCGCRTIIYGDDSDNSAVFNSDANPVDRAKTTAFKEDSTQIDDVANGQPEWYFDVTEIAQEIVSREGFSSGNAMSFLIEDHDPPPSGKLNVNVKWYTIDEGDITVARLMVWWTEAEAEGQVITIGARDEQDFHNPRFGIPPDSWE